MQNLALKTAPEHEIGAFGNTGKDVVGVINLKDRLTEELIIAFCGPIGAPIHEAVEETKEVVQGYGYEVVIIKLSDYIREHHPTKFKESQNEYERIDAAISAGNALREKHGNDILAQFAVRKIALERSAYKNSSGTSEYHSRRFCYLIDSVKNNFEYELLQRIYGDMFYMFGIYSPVDDRNQYLEKKGILSTQKSPLMDKDSGEELKSGQKVDKTFPLSDFFIKVKESNLGSIKERVERFCRIIFRNGIITPTKEEFAMYSAYSASVNSGCLSRKVGAAIVDVNGSVLSLGWNDVPKFGGDLYRDSGPSDNRCYNCGGCKKDEENERTIDSILLSISGIIPKEKLSQVKTALSKRIGDYIEHSKAIHAEMHALVIGSQHVGSAIKGANLFCTTYPCHICARHLVCAGINTVYYVEPYRKSYAIKLHKDSITEDDSSESKMRILMYEGVAPRKYIQFFKNEGISLKDDKGRVIKKSHRSGSPKIMESLDAFPFLEQIVVTNLEKEVFKSEVKNEAE